MFQCAPETEPATLGCLCHSPAFAGLNAHLGRKISRRSFLAGSAAAGAALFASGASAAVPKPPAGPVAFTNVRIFDSRGDTLRPGLRVVVDGKTIRAVEPADAPLPPGTGVIDGRGRTLMPGLIDAHYHVMMASLPMPVLLTADLGYITLAGAGEAERLLMRGFTSVRDMAGPTFGLKRAIDQGLVPGPRIWPSGAMISQTSGHGDFRLPWEVPAEADAPLSRGAQLDAGIIADGVPEVLKRAREQLMLGASQLKLAAGGGVASSYDPIDVSQYTEAEFRAAVEAAENWGTYVAVHAYTPRAIQTAIRAGVRCIEHGQLMDEESARAIADKGFWLSTQPFVADASANAYPPGSASAAKQAEMFRGTDTAYGLAIRHRLKTAWGTDVLFTAGGGVFQGAKLAGMVRWYSPAEILRTATSVNAELLAMSGPRSPYPGKLGVIEPGAYADILLVDGDPIAEIKLVADPERNFSLIMKDGVIYKNALPA